MKNISILALLPILLIFGCKNEDFIGQYPTDETAPSEVKSTQVKNLPGAAVIKYSIPNDDDFLYVKAVYERGGKLMEQKASVYNDSLLLEGFGRSQEIDVQLFAMDRSNNASNPVNVKIHPLDAPIFGILESMKVQDDFGGIRLDWNNDRLSNVIVSVLTKTNEFGVEEFTEAETFYSKAKAGFGNVRGYADTEKVFGVYVRDIWGNKTDTIFDTFHPIFETQLDKSLFRRWNPPGIPYDGYTTANWRIENFWDGKIGTKGNAMNQGFANLTKLEFTFDMGQTAKLSRFKINQRSESNLIYGLGHPKKFQLWGSTTPNVNQDFATWIYLGEFESIKPSGLPLGQVSDDDIRYAWENGEEWNVPLEAPAIRYIRFVAQETWGNASAVQMLEITLFGDNKY